MENMIRAFRIIPWEPESPTFLHCQKLLYSCNLYITTDYILYVKYYIILKGALKKHGKLHIL